MRNLFLSLFLILALNPVARAHHGLALFDTSTLLTLRGTVTGYRLLDPHSVLVVTITREDGSVVVWELEGGSGHGLVAAGLSREFLDSQPLVEVDYYPVRDSACDRRCHGAGRDFRFAER